MKMIKLVIFGIVLGSSVASPLFSQQALAAPREIARGRSDGERFRVVELVSGLANPWSVAFLPGGDALVTERSGALFLVRDLGAPQAEILEVSGLPRISANAQGGLLDVVLHPEFVRNRLVYFTYSSRYGFGEGTTLGRARLDGTTLLDFEELFRINRSSSGGIHFGSRLVFAPDGSLYMTIGDRGDRTRSQDLGDHAGTVLRFNDDGTVPRDNPFLGTRDALPEIFSYGHRNAQGMTIDPETGQVWLHEHGPRGGDEINIVRPGANYGWPVISYGAEYGSNRPVGEGTSKPGMEQPVLHWTPSIAPSGMTIYRGDLFPEWNGDIFAGALAGQHLRRVERNGDEAVDQDVMIQGVIGRIRDVRTGPDGALYLLTDEQPGGLYRIEPVE